MENINDGRAKSDNPTTLRTLANFLGQDSIVVVVPKIQRGYAQGRKSEENIRIQFCDELFSTLENGENIELSFVYGSKTVGPNGTIRFELLDGQQRITTLVLLYWFLACASGRDLPAWLAAFTYETRTTSAHFLHELSKSTIEVTEDRKPSEIIRDRQWYTLAYDKDSSVEGMLTMLDAFHSRYNASTKKEILYGNLENIRFYELDLDDFGLTEEIYIKMNARGLQLTPFENFKADILKYLKDDKTPAYKEKVKMAVAGQPEVDYYLNFSQKMDNRWLDIFWRKGDGEGPDYNGGREYCARFFRFFQRYFSNKCYLEVQSALPADSFRPNAIPDSDEGRMWHFLWSLSPKQDKTYLGFKYYAQILARYPQYIYNIEKILDHLSDKEVSEVIKAELVNPWDNNDRRQLFEEKYQLADAICFAAVTEYIEKTSGAFDTANFRRWMRVVRNVTENQLLRNVNEMVTVVRNLRAILDIEGAADDLYKALSTVSTNNRSLLEEIEKAKIIVADKSQDWEQAFTKAESHPLFRGAIGFLMEDMPSTVDAFSRRASLAGELFDASRMTGRMRVGHKLIRCLVRQLNSKEQLVNTTLTEKSDSVNHLKSMMLTYPGIRSLVCSLGDLENLDAVEARIDSILEEPVVSISADGRLNRAFERLCTDPRIYDFIDKVERENPKKSMVISERDGNYAVDRARSWYDWIFLGTERKDIIDFMLGRGFTLTDNNQQPFKDKYGDYFGYCVWIEKRVYVNQKLTVEFHNNGNARFWVHESQKNVPELFPDVTPDDKGWMKIKEIPAGHASDCEAVLAMADEMELLMKEADREKPE